LLSCERYRDAQTSQEKRPVPYSSQKEDNHWGWEVHVGIGPNAKGVLNRLSRRETPNAHHIFRGEIPSACWALTWQGRAHESLKAKTRRGVTQVKKTSRGTFAAGPKKRYDKEEGLEPGEVQGVEGVIPSRKNHVDEA